MYIGSHISSAGGVQNAPQNSSAIKGEVFQFFSRSPRGGQAPELTHKIITEFQDNMRKYKQKECYIHAPYYINLASEKNNIYFGSISVLREELERGSKLGAKYMMTHLGSAKDLGEKQAIKKVARGISEVLRGYQGATQFLIEMSAGTGMIIGDTFEEIAEILKNLKFEIKNPQSKIGICFDTAHAFESGYDLRDKKSVKKTFDDFNKILGLKKLKLIHLNDSKTDLGSRRDRHEDIGKGKIGLAGFRALMADKRLKDIDLILETPTQTIDRKNINIIKKLRKEVYQ
ncbi:MAG: deoxyribonuclease IV [Candidatus Kuenenbacteria bacterium]